MSVITATATISGNDVLFRLHNIGLPDEDDEVEVKPVVSLGPQVYVLDCSGSMLSYMSAMCKAMHAAIDELPDGTPMIVVGFSTEGWVIFKTDSLDDSERARGHAAFDRVASCDTTNLGAGLDLAAKELGEHFLRRDEGDTRPTLGSYTVLTDGSINCGEREPDVLASKLYKDFKTTTIMFTAASQTSFSNAVLKLSDANSAVFVEDAYCEKLYDGLRLAADRGKAPTISVTVGDKTRVLSPREVGEWEAGSVHPLLVVDVGTDVADLPFKVVVGGEVVLSGAVGEVLTKLPEIVLEHEVNREQLRIQLKKVRVTIRAASATSDYEAIETQVEAAKRLSERAEDLVAAVEQLKVEEPTGSDLPASCYRSLAAEILGFVEYGASVSDERSMSTPESGKRQCCSEPSTEAQPRYGSLSAPAGVQEAPVHRSLGGCGAFEQDQAPRAYRGLSAAGKRSLPPSPLSQGPAPLSNRLRAASLAL